MQLVAIKRAAARPDSYLSFSLFLSVFLPLFLCLSPHSLHLFNSSELKWRCPTAVTVYHRPLPTADTSPFTLAPSLYLSLWLPLSTLLHTACLPQRFVAHKFHALHLRVSGTANMQHMAAILERTQTKHS